MRAIITTTVALLLFLTVPTFAHADGGVPDDVVEVFATQALEDVHRNSDATVITGGSGELGEPAVDYSDVTKFGTVFEVFTWSREFIFDRKLDSPTRPMDEWIAPALRDDDEPVGTYSVWRPETKAPAEPGSFDNNRELGNALKDLPEGASLVVDPTIAGWYYIKGNTVTALNPQAAAEIPKPISLEEFAPIVAERYAQAIDASKDLPGATGGGGPGEQPWYRSQVTIPLAGGFTALAIAALIALVLRRSSRNIQP